MNMETAETTGRKWLFLVFLIILSSEGTFSNITFLLKIYFQYWKFTILTFILMFVVSEQVAIKHVSGVIILLSWVEAVLLIGGHKRLSTYITMFSKVMFNFSKFLTWFFSFIIAFWLCFFIIFHHPEGAWGWRRNKWKFPESQ